MFDTDGIPEEFFVKFDFEKKNQQTTKRKKNSLGSRVKGGFCAYAIRTKFYCAGPFCKFPVVASLSS